MTPHEKKREREAAHQFAQTVPPIIFHEPPASQETVVRLIEENEASREETKAFRETVAQLAEQTKALLEGKRPTLEDAPAILSHGKGMYSVPGRDPFTVSASEDYVLQPFLKASAMDLPTLELESKVDRCGAVLRKLVTKYQGAFKPYVTLPGGKGKGGYSVRIRSVQ